MLQAGSVADQNVHPCARLSGKFSLRMDSRRQGCKYAAGSSGSLRAPSYSLRAVSIRRGGRFRPALSGMRACRAQARGRAAVHNHNLSGHEAGLGGIRQEVNYRSNFVRFCHASIDGLARQRGLCSSSGPAARWPAIKARPQHGGVHPRRAAPRSRGYCQARIQSLRRA